MLYFRYTHTHTSEATQFLFGSVLVGSVDTLPLPPSLCALVSNLVPRPSLVPSRPPIFV